MKKKITRGIIGIVFLHLLLIVVNAAVDAKWISQKQIKLPAKATVLAYSSDASRIAVGHPDGRVSVWNVKTGELVTTINGHQKEINSVQFIIKDSQLFTMGDDNRARFWSTTDWKEVRTIDGVAFSGGVSLDGLWLAAQDPKQAIWIWDLMTLKQVKQLTEAGKGGTQYITFSADGKLIMTAYNSALLINVETKQSIPFVASGDKKTDVKIEPAGNGQISISLGKLQDDDAITHRVIPSRVGTLVALGRGWYGQSGFVDVWDISVMKRLGRFKPKGAGTLTSFSFDNSLLAIEGDENVTIWDIKRGKQIASVKGGGIMQFSPNSMDLVVTDDDNLLVYAMKQ